MMKKIEINIDGMSCNHCVARVMQLLEKNKDLKIVELSIGKAIISIDDGCDIRTIASQLENCGYKVSSIK